MERKIEEHNKADAKRLIDSMFDAKIFADRITRDDMNWFENLIAFNLQCKEDSSIKIAEFKVKYKD